jgi:hypothetical protein
MSEGNEQVTLVTTPDAPAAESVAGEAEGATPPVAAEVPATDSAAAAPPVPDPALSRRFELAKQAELQAARARERVTRETEQARAALRSEREKFDQERESARAALRDWEQAQADPVAFALSRVKPEELGARIASAGSPEAQELRALRARLDAADEAKKKFEEQQKEREQEDVRRSAMVSFVSQITPDECPHLTDMYEAREVPALVERALREHGPAFRNQHGRNPTDAELRAFLEYDAKMRYEKRRKAQQAPESVAASVNGKSGSAASAPGTLTNNLAGKSAGARPTGGQTREERRKALIAQLEAEGRESE